MPSALHKFLHAAHPKSLLQAAQLVAPELDSADEADSFDVFDRDNHSKLN
jgi:hypothetical protein